MTPAQFWQIEMQNQQNQRDNMQQMTNQVFQAAGALAGQYAENKALDAKGTAYADFMKSHGEQLGFDPNYLEDFLKKKPREQAMIGDSIIGMQNTGRNIMSQQIVGMQMAPRAAYGTAPAAGGGGGGDVLTF
jgi:hypothetical protein